MCLREVLNRASKKNLNSVSSDDNSNSHWGKNKIQKSIKETIRSLVIPLPRSEITTVVNMMVNYPCRLFSVFLFENHSSSQNVIPRLIESVAVHLLEKQILRPQPKPTE